MLHEIFDNAVRHHPNNVVLQYEDETALTYAELSTWANQVAHYLRRECGVQQGDHVVVRMPRGAHQVPLLLALSMLGAVYVPVSAAQPKIRLQQILADCAPQHLITWSDLDTGEQTVANVIYFDKCLADITKENSAPFSSKDLSEQSLLYIAYSSGSSGKPKGIPIRQAGLSQYWVDVLKTHIKLGVGAVCASISIDFDAHIMEYIMAWVFGGRIHIASEATRTDSLQLANFIVNHHITDALTTPSVLKLFSLKYLNAMKDAGFQYFHTTGEKISVDIVRRCAEAGIGVFNCYGPTEATFGLSMLDCKLPDFVDGVAPIAPAPKQSSVKTVILDEQGEPSAEGKSGELVIISPFLTPGYLNRPEEQSRFFNYKGERAYRTGDQFTQIGDKLYCSGRLAESQTQKIHGQYIDCEGTERRLREHPAIMDADVSIRSVYQQTPVVVAFLVLTPKHAAPSTAEIQQFCLEGGLLKAATPSFLKCLKALPVTQNGKRDKQALSAIPIQFARETEQPLEATPCLNLEADLRDIWHTLLHIDKDNDFVIATLDTLCSLGGSSINLMALTTQIKEKFDLTVPVSALTPCENLTIRKLAGILFKYQSLKHADRLLTKVAPGSNTVPLVLIPPVTGEGHLTYQPLYEGLKQVSKAHKDRAHPLVVLNSLTLLDDYWVTDQIEVIADTYLALVNKCWPEGGIILAGWSSGGTVAYEMARQLEIAGRDVEDLFIIDQLAPSFLQSLSTHELAEALSLLATHLQDTLISPDTKASSDALVPPLGTLASLPAHKQIDTLFNQRDLTSPELRRMLQQVRYALHAELEYRPSVLLSETAPTCLYTEQTRARLLASRWFKAQAGSKTKLETSLGWNEYAEVTLSSALEGDHFSIISKPDVGLCKLLANLKMRRSSSEEEEEHRLNSQNNLSTQLAKLREEQAERERKQAEREKRNEEKLAEISQILQNSNGSHSPTRRPVEPPSKPQTNMLAQFRRDWLPLGRKILIMLSTLSAALLLAKIYNDDDVSATTTSNMIALAVLSAAVAAISTGAQATEDKHASQILVGDGDQSDPKSSHGLLPEGVGALSPLYLSDASATPNPTVNRSSQGLQQ